MSLTITPDTNTQTTETTQGTQQTTQQVELKEPAPGTPEYDAKMAEIGRQHRTEETKPTEQRPEYLPEKFWSEGKADYESLAKAYAELEKKLGSGSQETKTDETQTQTAATAEIAEDAMQRYAQEITSAGALSEDSYKELLAKGYPKALVDSYVELYARDYQTSVEQMQTRVLSTVGGKDSFNAMSQWAAVNLSDAELKVFNDQVGKDENSATLAVQWLKGRYEAVNGRAPKLTQGVSSPSVTGGFASQSEVIEAMKSPKYATDPAYRAEVARRIAAKTF